MNEVVSRVRDAVIAGVSATAMEELARAEVAQEMLEDDRVLRDDEVLEIAEDVVDGESIIDPQDSIVGEEASMTKPEYDNLPPDVKVKDTDGDDAVIVGSRVYKVKIRESDIAQRIAKSITSDMHGAFGIAAHDASYSSYNSPMKLSACSCPNCFSGNTTVVWYDGESNVVHCNDCGAEFDCAHEDERTIEEITMDEFQIIDEPDYSVFGTIFFSSENGWTFQIWENGEVTIEGVVEDPADAYEWFDAFPDFEESLSEDSVIIGSNGKRAKISKIGCHNVTVGEDEYSSIVLLAACKMGYLSIDASDVYDDPILPGDLYVDAENNSIQVEEMTNGDVVYVEDVYDESTACRRMSYKCATRQQFLSIIDNGGYSLMF